MSTKNRSTAAGSSFNAWVNEHDAAFKAELMAGAMKRHFAIKLRGSMKAQGIGVNTLQKRLGTGPSQVQRLLDPEDIGISLKSIARSLAVLGMTGHIAVEPNLSKKQVA